jgi:hypothetical protein
MNLYRIILVALAGLWMTTCGGASESSAPYARADTLADSPAERAADASPVCLQQMLYAAQGERVSFWRCTYQGQTVYFEPVTRCCDLFSTLYAADCTVICAPDGGISGGGDGRCPDFDGSTCEVNWQDGRTP